MGLIICYSCGRQRNMPKGTPKPTVCGNCGARGPRVIYRVTSRMRLNGIREEDGVGIELHAARERTLGGLKWIADQKGYKPAWPTMQFLKMYGSKPNGESNCDMLAPSQALLHWVQRQNNAYKKRMRAIEAAQAKPVVVEKASALMSEDDYAAFG